MNIPNLTSEKCLQKAMAIAYGESRLRAEQERNRTISQWWNRVTRKDDAPRSCTQP